jgi:Fe-S cluster assembly iron-binding protein IscA
LALDEPTQEDEVADFEGFSVIAEKALLAQVGGLSVDYVSTGWRQGFSIVAEQEDDTGSSHCGSCGCS